MTLGSKQLLRTHRDTIEWLRLRSRYDVRHSLRSARDGIKDLISYLHELNRLLLTGFQSTDRLAGGRCGLVGVGGLPEVLLARAPDRDDGVGLEP